MNDDDAKYTVCVLNEWIRHFNSTIRWNEKDTQQTKKEANNQQKKKLDTKRSLNNDDVNEMNG